MSMVTTIIMITAMVTCISAKAPPALPSQA